MKKHKDLYKAIFESSGVAYLLVNAAILEANASAAEMWGRPKEAIVGQSLADFAPASQPNGRPSAEAAAEMLAEARAGKSNSIYWQSLGPDDQLIDCEVQFRGLDLAKGKQVVLVTMRQVTDFLRLAGELAHSEAKYNQLDETARRDERMVKSLLSVSGDPIVIYDGAGNCSFVNKAFSATFGWSLEKFMAGGIDFVPPPEAASKKTLWREIKAGRKVVGLETRRLAQDGKEIPVTISAASISNERGEPAETLMIFRDITAQHQAAEALQKAYELQKELAERDALTGLLNHRRLNEELNKEMERARRQNTTLSLVMMDLDNFKQLNDTYGHLVGDQALRLVSQSLMQTCRVIDVVGRYGGDEFLIILPGTDAEGAKLLAERITEDLSLRTLEGAGQNHQTVSASLGLSTFPYDAGSPTILLDMADKAMYRSKVAPGHNVISWGEGSEIVVEKPSSFEAVLKLVATMDRRDHYTRRHSEKVAEYARRLGSALGLEAEVMERLNQAALVHDAGNIYIPEEILLKADFLTEEEFETLRQHPIYTHNLLKNLPGLHHDVLLAALHHHEHWDGGGYPHRLKAKNIPYLARILTVADTTAALSMVRPYRQAFRLDEIHRELEIMAGKALDPDLVPAFLKVFVAF
ncbi:MAG: diguanylate cyclase [Deltaproteobacteria bacterium]|nr:diguanylate cyclase [Deltaproteobacteria bacterium]